MTSNETNLNHRTIEDEAYWKNHIASLKTSKLTRKEYCQRYNVNYDRFGYWLSRLHPTRGLISVKMKLSESTPINPLCTLTLENGKSLLIYDHQTLLFILERFE